LSAEVSLNLSACVSDVKHPGPLLQACFRAPDRRLREAVEGIDDDS